MLFLHPRLQPACLHFTGEIDWHLNRPPARDYKVLSQNSIWDLLASSVMQNTSVSNKGPQHCVDVSCAYLLSRLAYSPAVRLERDERCSSGIGQKTLLSLQWGTRNGIKVCCSVIYPCKTAPPLCGITFPVSQPCSHWPTAVPGVYFPPSQLTAFSCQSAMKEACSRQKQHVKTKRGTPLCLHYLLVPPSLNEARVNCC